jgi:hypothetical protein
VYTTGFYTPLDRRGKRGGISKSNRDANTDNGISIIAIQVGCVRINCQTTVGVDALGLRDYFGGVVVSVLVGCGAD